jgi:hypothetical protein
MVPLTVLHRTLPMPSSLLACSFGQTQLLHLPLSEENTYHEAVPLTQTIHTTTCFS